MARERGGFVEGHDENIGKGEHANMPKEVMMKAYPKCAEARDKELDDTMSDIDAVQEHAASRRNRYVSNQK